MFRVLLLTIAVVVAASIVAEAQPASRVTMGPVARLDRIWVEAGGMGTIPAAGVVADIRLSAGTAIEADLTHALADFGRTYTGMFVSYVPTPNPTREEIERWAPVARRTLGYEPGVGWTIAFVVRGSVSERLSLAMRAGALGRRYRHTSHFDVLSIPEGVDPARVARDFADESGTRIRGGLLLGLDVAMRLTPSLALAPDVRFVWGGPAQVGDKYREFGAGVRLIWTPR